jgi:hypothetical protein
LLSPNYRRVKAAESKVGRRVVFPQPRADFVSNFNKKKLRDRSHKFLHDAFVGCMFSNSLNARLYENIQRAQLARDQLSKIAAKIDCPITAWPPFMRIGTIAERSRASATLYFMNRSPLAKAA